MIMRLAIQTLLLPGRDLDEKFTNAARFGFDLVEVAIGPEFDLAGNLQAIQRASRHSGLPVSDICTHPIHDPFVPDLQERSRRLSVLAELLGMADELGAAGVICVPLRPPHDFPDLSPWLSRYQAIQSLVVAALTEWSSALPPGEAAVFLEPLNRYETGFLNRVEQAVDICWQVSHPRVKVMADFFHMNIEEASFEQPFKLAGELLGLVHIADNNRLQPGLGCIDFRPGFAALKAIGYRGPISIECWSPQGAVIAGDPQEALPKTVAYLRSVWDSA